MIPDYQNMGLSITMGPRLRKFIEDQLIEDMKYYNIVSGELRFDWSNSCIEGKDLTYLDGTLDRYSGIFIFDADDKPIADGWMDFKYIHETDQLIVYWLYLDVFINDKEIMAKKEKGMPNHIKERVKRLSNNI